MCISGGWFVMILPVLAMWTFICSTMFAQPFGPRSDCYNLHLSTFMPAFNTLRCFPHIYRHKPDKDSANHLSALIMSSASNARPPIRVKCTPAPRLVKSCFKIFFFSKCFNIEKNIKTYLSQVWPALVNNWMSSKFSSLVTDCYKHAVFSVHAAQNHILCFLSCDEIKTEVQVHLNRETPPRSSQWHAHTRRLWDILVKIQSTAFKFNTFVVLNFVSQVRKPPRQKLLLAKGSSHG